ncbi:MAG TPA: biotin synthase BioB [Ilumatobacter sp.]|nr:biotin synthase BioB [Ilumatobacter sp.]
MQVRHDWTVEDAEALIARPFHALLAEAHSVHAERFDPQVIEAAILLSIKTGACPEDCAYCPQSARYDTGVSPERLMPTDEIVAAARNAQASGATRFCMGAAWREPNDRQVAQVSESVAAVRALGMETCVTLGMLTSSQADQLAASGLDFYNHNLDTSPEFYGEVITTRTYDDRLNTLARVRDAGVKLCCGGIVGMGESRRDRAGLLVQLAALDPHPESVPINLLVQVPGTPLHGTAELDPLELVRTIAAARLMMPESVIRLSAGRSQMTDELQALCLHAGASSLFLGDQLLTTPNPGKHHDQQLLDRLDTNLADIDRDTTQLTGATRVTVSTIASQIC